MVFAAIGPDGVDFAFRDCEGQGCNGIEHVAATDHSTFTEALLRYVDRHALKLSGSKLYIAVAGAVDGDTIKITNGRWFVSRSGLKAITGSDAFIINDVSAIAYATLDGKASTKPVGPLIRPEAEAVGRRAIVWAGAGLGAACLDRRGTIAVIDSEAGHAPFVAQNDVQRGLVAKQAGKGRPLSYEQMVFLLHGDRSFHSDEHDKIRSEHVLAEVLGQFCSSVVLFLAAWEAVYVCGPIFEKLERTGVILSVRQAFDGSLAPRRKPGATALMMLGGSLLVLRGLMEIGSLDEETRG